MVLSSVLLVAQCAASATEPQLEWTPRLPTGESPVALARLGEGFVVINAGPTDKARTELGAALEEATEGEAAEVASLLDTVRQRLPEYGSVMSYKVSTDRFWPWIETVLCERSEETVAGVSDVVERAGRPQAVQPMIRGGTQVLLVATDEYLFELAGSDLQIAEIHSIAGIRAMAAGDLTDDGREELIVATGDAVVVYKAIDDGFEEFSRWHTKDPLADPDPSALGIRPSGVVLADLWQDGALDIIIAHDGREVYETEEGIDPDTGEVTAGEVRTFVDNQLFIIRSYGMGEFSDEPMRVATTPQVRSLITDDFTGNGQLDIVVAGVNELVLHRGRGDGRFDSRQVLASDPQYSNSDLDLPPVALAAFDFDGDGYKDLAVANPETGKIEVFWGGSLANESVVGVLDRPVDLLPLDIEGVPGLVVLDQAAEGVRVFTQHVGRQLIQLHEARLGWGSGLVTFAGAESPEGSYLAVAPGMLDPEGVARPGYDRNREWFTEDIWREGFAVVEVGNMRFQHHGDQAQQVRPIIMRGGAFGGVPVGEDEHPDYSFSIVKDREDSRLTTEAATQGRFPMGGAFVDVYPPIAEPAFAPNFDGVLRVDRSPWTDTGRFSLSYSLPARIAAIDRVGGFCFADLNDSGVSDLVVADQARSVLWVALAERDIEENRVTRGTFSFDDDRLARYSTGGADPVAVVAADLDADGYKDLAVLNAGSDSVTILWGKGDGTFERNGTQISVGVRPMAIVATAVSSGEEADSMLAVANSASDTISVILFEGREPQVSEVGLDGGRGPMSLATGSLDWLTGAEEDAFTDLAVACYASDEVLILRGDGDGGFEVYRIDDSIPVHDVLAVELEERTGHGPRAVVVGDFDDDGTDDIAFGVEFPTVRLAVQQAEVRDSDARDVIEGLWQDVFVYYSGGAPRVSRVNNSDVPSTGLAHVATGMDQGRNVLAVVQPSTNENDENGYVASVFAMGPHALEWEDERRASLDARGADFAMADLDGDGLLDVAAVDTRSNEVTVYWGPDYEKGTITTFAPTSPAPAAVAGGSASEGAWVLGGGTAWVSSSPGPSVDGWERLVLDLAGGYVRDAWAVTIPAGRGPPDLAVLSYRTDLGQHELRLFRGQGLLEGIASAWRVWELPHRVSALAVGDIVGDRQPDVVVTYEGRPVGDILLASGERKELRGIGEDCVALALGDISGDGLADLVALRGPSLAPRVVYYLGSGDGTFTRSSHELRVENPIRAGGLELADVNGNGRQDVLVYDRDAGLVVVFHNGGRLDMERTVAGLWLVDRGFSVGSACMR